MKKMRKLLPAIAMLLVSAVMMSTASFAWFTMNTEVRANNITVNAIAPASLWISQTATTGWDTVITLENENGGLSEDGFIPVQIKGGSTLTNADGRAEDGWTFEQLTGESATTVDPDGSVVDPDFAEEASTSYYKETFYLKLDAEYGTEAPVYVKVGIANKEAITEDRDPDEIYKALRVAVVVDGRAIIFEPQTDLAKTTTMVMAQVIEANATVTESDELKNYKNINAIGLLAGGAAATTVNVYVWLEGEDADCKNTNALHIDEFVVTLIFSTNDNDAVDITPTPGS